MKITYKIKEGMYHASKGVHRVAIHIPEGKSTKNVPKEFQEILKYKIAELEDIRSSTGKKLTRFY